MMRRYPQPLEPPKRSFKPRLVLYQFSILLGFIAGAYLAKNIPVYALVIVAVIQLIVIIATIFH